MIFYYFPSFRFSPKCAFAKSPSSHRHAAYKIIILIFQELYSIYLTLSYYKFNITSIQLNLAVFIESDMKQNVLSDRFYYSSMNDAKCNDLLLLFFAAFTFGLFHYLTISPLMWDRLIHKIMAVTVTFLCINLNRCGQMIWIMTLFWKTFASIQSVDKILYLSNLNKIKLIIFYINTTFITTIRLFINCFALYAGIKVLYIPCILNLDPIAALFGCLYCLNTFLHVFWAFKNYRKFIKKIMNNTNQIEKKEKKTE